MLGFKQLDLSNSLLITCDTKGQLFIIHTPTYVTSRTVRPLQQSIDHLQHRIKASCSSSIHPLQQKQIPPTVLPLDHLTCKGSVIYHYFVHLLVCLRRVWPTPTVGRIRRTAAPPTHTLPPTPYKFRHL